MRAASLFWAVVPLCFSAALWMAAVSPFPDEFSALADMSISDILFFYGSLPRAIIALVAGGLLGLSGALLQITLRNPIADPTTLGLSSGAQLALIAATVFAPSLLAFGRWPVAMLGAGGACAVVMGVSAARQFQPVVVVVTGMLVSLFASALATAITLSQGEYLFSMVVWNGGSLVQTNWGPSLSLGLVLAATLLCAALMAKPLGVLGLGAESASSLGLPVSWVRAGAVMIAAIAAASVSASVGLISFVGLAAPALARGLGARSILQILFGATFLGAISLSLLDNLVHWIANQGAEMFPTGAITGLFGGPLILVLLTRLRSAAPAETPHSAHRINKPQQAIVWLALAWLFVFMFALLLGRMPDGWWWLGWSNAAEFLPDRAPRIIGAASAGGLLALSGALLQRLTANPLAAPEVLGVSGGASVGYAAVVFTFAAPSALFLQLGAAAGGAAAIAIISLYALKRDMRPDRVLLAGISISAFAASVLTAIMASGSMKAFLVMAWVSGASASLTLPAALFLAAVLGGVWAIGLFARRWLSILPLGAQTARGLGVPMRTAWGGLIVLAGLATGCATIFAGPLSFVGLMAPHLARRLGFVTATGHMSASVLLGALIMTTADFGARMATFPYDLPPGLFAALIGAPWLIWLLVRRS